MINDLIENYKNDIIQKTQELIQIPSILSSSEHPLFPFGKPINDALEYMLKLGKDLGFRTKNLDGYCGYIEFGEGKELIGIIGHLDVVPEGDHWNYPPFGGTIANHKIYGRGAIDDKGPVISSLYAMKAVMDNCHVQKRVRLILGLNEENDWKCIQYYKKHEELPTIAFSPDADFPCIYSEKAILTSYLKMDYSTFLNKDLVIKSIDTYGNAINVVPKICSIILKINPQKITMDDLVKNLKHFIEHSHFEIDLYKIDEQEIKLTSHGVSSHSAHPELGINAISRLIVILSQIFQHYDIPIELFDFFSQSIHTQYHGESLGINFEDESGKLTLNVGDFYFKNNILQIGLNLRIPITVNMIDIGNSFIKHTSSFLNVDFDTISYKPALYLSKENKLVKTLCRIYNEETHSNLEPIAIGGATYARAFDSCVSFGANFPNDKDMCHQVDEFIEIDKLLLSCQIYAKAILALNELT
ncbi:MAG: dipeptidase PepV [Clostridia bacterium]|nr:dipeptidase PepV [Clostridia bacterium]